MREQLSLSDIQYGPFLPFLRKKDVTDIDYNGRELWIRDIHNIRHKVTDEKIRQHLNEEFIQSFATNVANLVGKNLTPTDNVIEAETEELRITVIHESVASTGTCICIRKTPPVQRITPKKALEEHYCEEKVLHLLANCVKAKLNMVFCGEPGVGKSAIAEGLAIRIMQKKVSRVLFDKRVVALDIASIVAGTKYRGQFEERMKAILNELAKNKNIILFIDEIHTIVGAGGSGGSLDAANMLKPALSRGEIQCIGATTLDEYRQNIEKDGALERRFQKVLVEATTLEETIEILNNIKSRYEDHHNVRYTPAAIKACVKLTTRYISCLLYTSPSPRD